MSRSSTHKTLLIVLIVLIVGGGLAAIMLASGGTLTGATEHDFGVLIQEDGQATGRHTFVLTNTTSRPLTIDGVKTSCGCSSAGPDVNLVEPGAQVRIDASLTIDGSMKKRVRVTVNLGDDGIVFLYLEGVSQRGDPLHVKRTPMELVSGDGSVNVYLEVYGSDDEPSPPTASASEGLQASVKGWTRGRRVNRGEGKPAVWSAQLTVTSDAETLGSDAAVTVEVPGVEAGLVIPVVSGLGGTQGEGAITDHDPRENAGTGE